MSVAYNGEHAIAFIYDYNSKTYVRKSWDYFWMIPATRPSVAASQPNYAIVSIPGSNDTIDLSTRISGLLTHSRRSGSWEFYIDHDMWGGDWHNAYLKIATIFNGRHMTCLLKDAPNYPYSGRVYLSDWHDEATYSRVTLTYDFDYTYDGTHNIGSMNVWKEQKNKGKAMWVKSQSRTVEPKATAQTVTPNEIAGYNFLDSVTVNGIPYRETGNTGNGQTAWIASTVNAPDVPHTPSEDDPVYINAQSKIVFASDEDQIVRPDSGLGYNCLSDVTVKGIVAEVKTVTPSDVALTVIPDEEGNYLGMVTVEAVKAQEKVVESIIAGSAIYPDPGYDYMSSVEILNADNAIPQDKVVIPTVNGLVVSSDPGYYLRTVTIRPVEGQSKIVTPTSTDQVVVPDSGYSCLTRVVVEGVGSGGGSSESEEIDQELNPIYSDGLMRFFISLPPVETYPLNFVLPIENYNRSSNTYKVDWGDGTVETLTVDNPSHSYASSGYYEIVLSYIDGDEYLLIKENRDVNYSSFKKYLYRFESGDYNNITIGDSAFGSCNTLKYTIIDDTFGSLGISAFTECCSLKGIKMSSMIRYIESYTFAGCSSLQKIVGLSSDIIEIGAYAFRYCYVLRELPAFIKVSAIGTDAFKGCYSLKSLSFGGTRIRFGNSCFENCSSLNKITLNYSSMPTLMYSNFNPIEGAYMLSQIRVPSSLLSQYQNDSYWGAYSNILVPIGGD